MLAVPPVNGCPAELSGTLTVLSPKVLLDQLLWWGSVLRDARRDRPYTNHGPA